MVQLSKSEEKKWVELPDCTGDPKEVKLLDDLANATWATCKVNAGVNLKEGEKKATAKEALDSVTPKADAKAP